MIRKIGLVIFHLISAFTFLSGLLAMALAAGVSSKYRLYDASAVQMTQVYSEGIYTALIGIGALLITLVIEAIIYLGDTKQKNQLETLSTEATDIRRVVRHIDSLIQKQNQNVK